MFRSAPTSPPAVSGRVPRRTSRRLIAFYALAIVGPTLALLYLGLESVRRQRDAIATLTAAAERMQLERLAAAVEARVVAGARACLTDERTVATVADTDWSSPEQAHVARATLDAICRAHPMCADLIVIGPDESGTPLLDEPLPRSPDALVAATADASTRQRLHLFSQAVKAEGEGRRDDAGRSYAAIVAGSSEPQLRALALGRLARLHATNGELTRASQAWRRLAGEYPAAYDLVRRPQAVVAALELAQLSRKRQPSLGTDPVVTQVRRSLAAGQWHVSPGQAAYFAAQLDAPAQSRVSSPAAGLSPFWTQSRLFSRIAVANTVRAQLNRSGLPMGGQVRSLSLDAIGDPHQVFAMAMPGTDGQLSAVVFDTDLSWVQETLLPQVRHETGGPLVTTTAVEPTKKADSVFRDAFRFWSLSVVEGPTDGRHWWNNEVLVFGGTTAGVLAVLVLGVVLLSRDVAREASTARLQADLVSGVSHELKTPLSVIRLYAESLASDDTGDDEPRAAHSRVILHESERLSHLVERVLSFSSQDAHEPSYQLECHGPARLVGAFIDRYTPYLTHLGFTVERDLDATTPLVYVDSAALTQALVNLVDNAVKYSGESRVLRLRVRPRGDSVLIEVEDQGIGIPANERGRLFEAFHRGARTAGRGGLGLGLYLVARIMQAHGGTIEIATPPTGGTCVRLVLPALTENEV